MKQKRKLLAVLVAFAMLIGGIPVGVFDVHAATGQHECTEHFPSEGSEWLILDENTTELEADKYYYLDKDLTLTKDIVVDDNITSNICLNGHDLSFEGDQL